MVYYRWQIHKNKNVGMDDMLNLTGGQNIDFGIITSLSINSDLQKNGAQKIIGKSISINIDGLFFSDNNDSFKILVGKESVLRNSLKDGLSLLGYSNAKVVSYSSKNTDNNWTRTIEYSVELLIEESVDGFLISSCEDSFSMELLEDTPYFKDINLNNIGYGNNQGLLSFGKQYPLYKISRTIGAVGKHNIDGNFTDAVNNAKTWVLSNINIDYDTMFNGMYLSNFVRGITSSDVEGSFKINDSWVAFESEPSDNEFFTLSLNIESALDTELIRTVTINGTIRGIEKIGSKSADMKTINKLTAIEKSKIENAIAGYSGNIKSNLFAMAQNYSPISNNNKSIDGNLNYRNKFNRPESPLNPIALNISETFNPSEGSITFTASYNNRPLSIIPGAIAETLRYDDNYMTKQIASIPILGYGKGPIFIDLGTRNPSTRSVTYEVTLPKSSGGAIGLSLMSSIKGQMGGIVDSFNPANGNYGEYISNSMINNSFDYSVIENRFSMQKTWEWSFNFN